MIARQRPVTASGVVFVSLEDETGTANLIVRPRVYERFQRAAREAAFVLARGRIERDGEVVHLLARGIADVGHLFGPQRPLRPAARDFH